MIPADIVMSVSTLSSLKVETPEEALMFDVIKSGNLASSIVPVSNISTTCQISCCSCGSSYITSYITTKVVAVTIPADIVIAVPTLSSVKVDTPEEALMFDVIKSGNLSSLIVPVTNISTTLPN